MSFWGFALGGGRLPWSSHLFSLVWGVEMLHFDHKRNLRGHKMILRGIKEEVKHFLYLKCCLFAQKPESLTSEGQNEAI